MTPTQLSTLANWAFGPQWRRRLARELGVGIKTVERWGQGRRPMPDATARRVAMLCLAVLRANQRAATVLCRKLLREQVRRSARAQARRPPAWRPLAGTERDGSR